jgi:hypothetical protein
MHMNELMMEAFIDTRSKVPTRPHPYTPNSGGVMQKMLLVGAAGEFKFLMIDFLCCRRFD